MSEGFSSVSRSRFCSIGRRLVAPTHADAFVGPCHSRVVSRARFGGSNVATPLTGLPSPRRTDVDGGSDLSPGAPLVLVGSDGSIVALEASLVPDLIVSVVSSGGVGRVEASQFISNEVGGVVGEYDSARVGADDDVGVPAGLVDGVSSGAEIDSCDCAGHFIGERRAVCGPMNAV